MNAASVRCFAGVELDPGFTASATAARSVILQALPGLADEKWVIERNLHLTLEFFGDVPTDTLEPLGSALQSELAGIESFALPVGGVKAVTRRRAIQMMWIALSDPDDAFTELVEAIRRAAKAVGCQTDTRVPRPHITLCRMRHRSGIDPSLEAVLLDASRRLPNSMSVPHATLFTSRLQPQGPTYQRVIQIPLAR